MDILELKCDELKEDSLTVFHSKDNTFGISVNITVSNSTSDGRYTDNSVLLEMDKLIELHKYLDNIIIKYKNEGKL